MQLTELLPGTIFGEIALFAGTMTRSASVHSDDGATVPLFQPVILGRVPHAQFRSNCVSLLTAAGSEQRGRRAREKAGSAGMLQGCGPKLVIDRGLPLRCL